MERQAVVVSGASTGIGRAIALHLDARGLRVFAGVRRDEDGEGLRAEAGELLTPVRLDVTDAAEVGEVADFVQAAAGARGLCGVVNNAGIAVAGPVEFVPLSEWRRQLEVNVLGMVSMVQAFAPALRESGGRIVSVGSLGGRLAQPMAAPYCASKYALEAISDALRIELRPWGISVSLIEPGAVKTPIWEKGLRAGEELLRNAPPQASRLYGAASEITAKTLDHENRTGVDPLVVARAVEHALLAQRPRPRYPVGRQARLLIPISRFLPDRIKDELLLRVSGLPRTPGATAGSSPAKARDAAPAPAG